MSLKLTEAEIDAARSPKGAWTAKTLKGWGVPWPPPHGWKAALLKGEPIPPPVAPREHNHVAKGLPQALGRLAEDLGVSATELRAVLVALVNGQRKG